MAKKKPIVAQASRACKNLPKRQFHICRKKFIKKFKK